MVGSKVGNPCLAKNHGPGLPWPGRSPNCEAPSALRLRLAWRGIRRAAKCRWHFGRDSPARHLFKPPGLSNLEGFSFCGALKRERFRYALGPPSAVPVSGPSGLRWARRPRGPSLGPELPNAQYFVAISSQPTESKFWVRPRRPAILRFGFSFRLMSKSVSEQLERLGLSQYAPTFAENDIDLLIFRQLTDADLKELGVRSLGHRRIILKAIESIAKEETSESSVSGEQDSSKSREAERRQLTIMFADLIGSTELSQQLDPEDLRDLNRAYQDACKVAIEQFDGYVARYMGDGVLAYFGYPMAHEDDAERAVRAGLDIVARISALSERTSDESGVKLAVRIGIATGPVVVGDLIGEGASQESAVVGETPNLAARLQSIADRNSLVIGPGTQRLLGEIFDLRELGEHELRGMAEPVRVWEVAGDKNVASRFQATRGSHLITFVGRDAELELLLSRWKRARGGEGQLVLLSGEPGIGKSRILEAVVDRLKGEAYESAFRYFCSPYHSGSALHPVIVQLEHAANFDRDDRADEKLEKLEAYLNTGWPGVAEVVPLFASLLSIPFGDRYTMPKLTPQAQRLRTFEAFCEYLAHSSAVQPILVILEDAHWLDPTSIELFGQFIDRLHELRVLLLITFRPEFNPPWIGFGAQITSLALDRLDRRQGRHLVERIVGPQSPSEDLLNHILQKTDGVPLFVEEYTKAILESGLLKRSGNRYEFSDVLPAQMVPATLHDSLMYRLDRNPLVKEVAQLGSVIGREFSYELVASVSSLSQEALEDSLESLVESELAFCRRSPPDATYTFKHALVQDAAYQSLLKSKRRRLHAQIANALRERTTEIAPAEPEVLAQHYTAAEMFEEAMRHWLAAGQRALMTSSLSEAVLHLSQALELTENISDPTDRADCELEVRTALGAATMALRGWPATELRDVVKPACALVEQGHGDSGDFMNFWNLWVHYGCRAEHREGLAVIDRMLKHAAERNDPVLTLISSFTAAMANLWVGNYELAIIHESTALDVYDLERDRNLVWSYNHDPKCTLLSWASNRVWAMGHADRARELSDAAVAHARLVGHPFNVCWTLGNSSITYSYCGDHSVACERIEELRRIAREQELTFMEKYMAPATSAITAAQVRDWETAYDQGARAEEIWQAIGGRFWSPAVKANMAWACLELGRPGEAVKLINEAINQIERSGEYMLVEEIHRIAGVVYLKQTGDQKAAENCFQRSFEFSRAHGTKSFELRTAMSLARLRRHQGRRQEGHDLLASIYDWFNEGFDTADLRNARDLIGELA